MRTNRIAVTALAAALCVPAAAETPLDEAGLAAGSGIGHGAEAQPHPESWGGGGLSALTLGSLAFTPMNGGTWSHASDGWSYRTGGGHVGTCANVNLPSGALLEAITTYSLDTDATNNVEFSLFSMNLATSFGTQPFLFITSGAPGVQRLLHTLTPPITINNDRRAYAICVFQFGTTSSTRNAGATFWYRLQVSAAPATATFGDVPVGSPIHRFVEALAASGISGGCGGGNFCPDAPLTRGQMAIFLAAALGLHFPN